MEENVSQKVCAGCNAPSVLRAPFCAHCGRQFPPPPDAPGNPFTPGNETPGQAAPARTPPPSSFGSPQPPPPSPPTSQPWSSAPPPPPYQPGQYSNQPGQPVGQQPYQQPPQFSGGRIQLPPGTFNVTNSILLAVFITGAGQMSNKQVAKGVVTLVAAIVLGILTLGIGSVLIWIVALVDAILIANRLNRGESVGEWQFF